MNYYSFHIGDFNNATRHLTRVERSLYRDLIDVYYDTEHALNGNDFDRLAKRVLANSDEEKKALKYVLGEFFILKDGEYHNNRCDAEISKYRANTESKRKAGKASATSRQQKSTPVEHTLNKCATNQEPITNNQELKTSAPKKPARFDPMAIDLPDCIPEDAWGRWITYRRQRRLSTTEQTVFAQIEKLVAWRGKGHSPPKIIDESIANGWQGLFEPKGGGTNNASNRESVIAAFTGSGQRQPAILEGYSERLVGSG